MVLRRRCNGAKYSTEAADDIRKYDMVGERPCKAEAVLRRAVDEQGVSMLA